MKIITYLPMVLFASSLYANSQAPAPMTVAPAPVPMQKKGFDVYVGLGGGYQHFGGKKGLTTLGLGDTVNLVTKKKIHDGTGKIEFFAGAAWDVATKIVLGVEANASFVSLQNKDVNVIFLPGDVIDSRVSKWKSHYSLGFDLKPVYKMNDQHSLYGLMGLESRKFRFTLDDDEGRKRFNKTTVGLGLGLGYEYKYGVSAIGIRYRASLYPNKTYNQNYGGFPYKVSLNPNIHSFLITYRVSLNS